MNFKKMSAKALSVFMSLIMLFSIVAPAVSAIDADHDHVTEKPEFNYVSLGDSMSNGYGMDNYGQSGYFDIFADGEVGHYGDHAYTTQFADYLALCGFDVNHSKLAASAMLSRDLLFLVGGGEYVEDGYTGFIDYVGRYCWDLIDKNTGAIVDEEFFAKLQNLYIEKIADADLITMGLGNAEFGAYIMHKLMTCLGFGGTSYTEVVDYVQLENLMDTCDPQLVAKVIELRDKLLADLPQDEALEGFEDEQIETIANLFIYTVLDFCNNYTKILDRIVELNPDVEIMIVGLMNTLNGVKFELNGEYYDLGEYMGYALDIVNAHLTTYATVQVVTDEAYRDATIYYTASPKVEVIIDTYADGLNDVVRNRFHETIVGKNGVANGYVWALMEAPYIALEEIKAFEEDRIGYQNSLFFRIPVLVGMISEEAWNALSPEQQMAILEANADKITLGVQSYLALIEAYLAFESAIVEASKSSTLSLDSFAAIQDLSIVLEDVMGAMMYDEEDVEAAILASKTNKDEVYMEFLGRLESDLNATGSSSYLKKITFYDWLVDYVYVGGDVTDFYADLEVLSEKELINKITLAIYNGYYTPIMDTLDPTKDYLDRSKVIARQLYEYATGIFTMEDYYDYYETLYFLPEYMSARMCENEVLRGLLSLFGRCLIGNGVGAHPSEDGHNDLFAAVKDAYVNQHTVVDETVDHIVMIRDYIFNNYDKFYEEAYKQAVKEGYIAQMDAYLVDAINAVRYAEDFIFGYEEYFLSAEFAAQFAACADSTVASIEALRAVIANADKLDAELNDTIVALAAQVVSNLNEFSALIKITVADFYAAGAPIVEAEIAKAIAIINAKVNAVLEAIAYVEAKVQEQIAIAEALIAEFVAVAEAYLAELFGEAVETAEDLAAKIEEAKAYLNALIKAFLSHSAYSANYTVTADSYYLAIGGDDAVYAELLAAKMGLGEDQFSATTWDNIDVTTLAKADLVTIGYTESMISGFATEQIIAYVVEYINVTLRESANEYVEDALTYFFDKVSPKPSEKMVEDIIAYFHEYVNGMFDSVVDGSGFGEAEIADMDWVELVGEENASYVEGALQTVNNALAKVGMGENFTKEIEVVELLIAELGSVEPTLGAMLAYFDIEEIKAMFGEYATFTLEIPVADAIAFAVESYIYSYAKFNVEYAQLVYAVNAINPDAQIVLLGNYNAFADLGFDFVVDEITIDLGEIFTSEVKDSANSYANEVFGAIIGALEDATDDETIDSVLGSVDSAITSGASTLYEIIFGILADVENVRDYIDGTEIGLPEISAPEISIPEISIPSCPALDSLVAILSKINFNAFADVDWVKLIGIDLNAIVADVLNGTAEAVDATTIALIEVIFEIQNAIVEVENTLVDLGIFETYTITLPTLDLIYDNLYMFDAETRALLESIDQEALRAMIGEELANFVVEVKTLSSDVVAAINGIYDMIADTEITVFEGATIDLGELISAPTSIHSLIYAYCMKNVIFVDISDAFTVEVDSIEDLLLAYLFDNSVLDMVDHEYIAEQIYAALNVKCGHRDADADHNCDYCGAELSACVDADKDHNCDYCGEALSECADADKDHNCDYCGEVLSECADADKDHKCDVCGAELSKCADANNDHKCDVCGAELSKCADANNDHKCDVCGAELSKCADANNDHKCDVCGVTMSQCADANNDHNCDVCGAKLSECADANNDHNCDVCGAKLSECADANNDHNCDVCGAKLSECADANNDHNCDVCGTKLSECADNDKDGKCDICGTELEKAGLSTGAVVAIVAGSVVVAAGIGVGIFFGIKTGFFAKLFKKK